MSLNRKIVYIEIDEEINLIFDRIKQIKEQNIFLVIPAKALIFQSILNLKILKTKSEDNGKELTVVTKDERGRKLCQNIQLKVIKSLEEESQKGEEVKIRINSVDAYKNETDFEEPQLKDRTKVSIADLVGKVSGKVKKGAENFRDEAAGYDFSFSQPNRKGLIAIILISLTLFFFISYIALPGATVYIKPKADVIETTVNIELADAKINQLAFESNPPYMVPTFPIEAVFEKKINFDTISTNFEGTNATGVMKLVNATGREWTLKSKTRFQNEEGIVFRSQAWVTVPPRKNEDEPGTATVEVVADEFDIYKEIVGERGNLPPSKFTIPGLSQYNQNLIWGITEAQTQGGTSKWSKLVQEDDVEAARLKVEKEVLESARLDIEQYIKRQNEINDVNLVLLSDPKYIKKEILEIRIPENVVGQKLESIEVYSKIQVTVTTYDQNKFRQVLRASLMAKVHPDMQLLERDINYDNIGYDIIDEDNTLQIIKVSATINGKQEFTIDPRTESGLRFVNKIKDAVVGKSKEDAENYIVNLREVSQAQVSTWPFFSTRMPGLPENIEIKLLEE